MIEVVGEANLSLVPDEIYVQITLKEYKKNGRKVTISSLEEQLINTVTKLNLLSENLTVANIFGNNRNWKRHRAADFLATKTFKLLLDDIIKVNDLTEMLPVEGVSSLGITEFDHSEITKLREELKVKAILTAKEKATKLLDAIDEELGGAVEVSELNNSSMYNRQDSYEDKVREKDLYANFTDQYDSDLEFKKIRLNASIKVIFQIK